MGHHGWQGNPPGAEDQARRRLVEAAIACIGRTDVSKISLSDVANEAGVTRQTVYRYFPSLSEILRAVGQAGADEFAERMQQHLAACESPAEAAVESVVFAVRTVPDEPYMGLLLQAGDPDFFTAGSTSPAAFGLGARILRNVPVDWRAVGVTTDEDLEGLAEVLMRLFISFLQYPSSPPLTDDRIRSLVRRWVGPALGGLPPRHGEPDDLTQGPPAR
ncbi:MULTISPECIES: TetR/AcrR family transcriptional regulator [Prauserella salsuginis group]|uniref:TetR/AcrR family transcriptional regulator n=1 Tax=Prauserella salsuginis TaxID=387889 RepID=A0ABW6G8J6_9PSEU|nr:MULTISPECIES: TetR/AcrR family transcriptional regulator [Prauserella salsuginis group]MCR3722620.1 transcriptional regulator, TetR family [Prauserella flava]MCR3737062.1 transcriptional regulator, TetR family [Prauserella salsuginis]